MPDSAHSKQAGDPWFFIMGRGLTSGRFGERANTSSDLAEPQNSTPQLHNPPCSFRTASSIVKRRAARRDAIPKYPTKVLRSAPIFRYLSMSLRAELLLRFAANDNNGRQSALHRPFFAFSCGNLIEILQLRLRSARKHHNT